MIRARLFAAIVIVLACSAVFAGLAGFTGRTRQPVNTLSTPLADMPVARMIGEWRGTSWMTTPTGERHEGEAIERARWNLAGTAIIVEGYGFTKDATTGAITVGHDAMGIIELDAKTDDVVFMARRNGAAFEKHTLTIEADPDEPGGERMVWSPNPGAVRFTLHITSDRWHEVGEWSRDGGKTWVEFMGVDLKPVKE